MYNPSFHVRNQQDSNNKTTGFEISKKTSGYFSLKIWGRFPPNWIGNLSTGLAKNHININSVSAKKVKTSWQADFEIAVTRSATDPNRIDYLALTQEDSVTASPDNISLHEFSFGDPGNNNGALYLELKAADQLGFLSTLLNRFAFYSLFPEEMLIETVNGRIFDRFWIKGVGGNMPSDTAINTLRQKLEGYLKK
jgi:hypothetical protein